MIHREQDIINWGIARNLIGPESQSDKRSQHKKTFEEVTELGAAIITNDTAAARDAIGDIIVTLVMQAQMWGLTITECLDAAWDEIKDRKGRMVDGIFVKESGNALPARETPVIGSWMEDALAMMELSAEVTAALTAPAGSDDPLKYFPGYAEACAKAEANKELCGGASQSASATVQPKP
jgi:NTP pyrophosphatase (non-canonical NTP hydrolase)